MCLSKYRTNIQNQIPFLCEFTTYAFSLLARVSLQLKPKKEGSWNVKKASETEVPKEQLDHAYANTSIKMFPFRQTLL